MLNKTAALLPFLAAPWLHAAPVSFTRDLAPILADKCLTCHQESKARGGYRVDTYVEVLKEGDTGPALKAGDPAVGTFLHLLTTLEEEDRMPQKDDALPPEQIELFRRWIVEGAKFDGDAPQASLNQLLKKEGQPVSPEKYPLPVPVTAVAWVNEGEMIATSGWHEMLLWEAAPLKLAQRIGNLPERLLALHLHPDGKRIVAAGGSPGRVGEAVIVDLPSGKVVQQLPATKDMLQAAVFSPDGSLLALGGADNSLYVYKTDKWELAWKADAHADWITSLAFSPDSSLLVSASRDRTARIFQARSGEPGITQTSHATAVTSVLFDREGKTVISASSEGEIRRWSITATPDGSGRVASTVLTGRRKEVSRLLLYGSRLMAASVDGRIRSFDLEVQPKDAKPADMPAFGRRIEALALDPAGKRAAIGGQGGRLRLFNLEERRSPPIFVAAPGHQP